MSVSAKPALRSVISEKEKEERKSKKSSPVAIAQQSATKYSKKSEGKDNGKTK